MKTCRHILLATDFSPHSERAAGKAAELAGLCGARLGLVHVIDYFPEDIPHEWVAPENVDPATYVRERADRALAELGSGLGAADAERAVILSQGPAAPEIVRHAKEIATHLIVVGSHGHRGIGGLLGSTAEHVVRQAESDVLVVRTD